MSELQNCARFVRALILWAQEQGVSEELVKELFEHGRIEIRE